MYFERNPKAMILILKWIVII